MEKLVHEKNVDQWCGLSEKYHSIRPAPPDVIIKVILSWLRKEPDTVVDVGCGTGLSSIIWKDIAGSIVGIEPNDDMRSTAEHNYSFNNLVFLKAVSNETTLPSDYADIITVSQAFHWMDIDSSLLEFYRILKPGGVLAIYDFVMPPVIDWEIEKAYSVLRRKCSDIVYSQETPPVHNDKSTYCDRVVSFGKFRHSRKVECHSAILMSPRKTAGFLVGISNASFAAGIKASIKDDIDEFCDFVMARYSGDIELILSYRVVIAIK